MRNEIKRTRVALQSELMKQQHWIAIPPGKMSLGKNLLITTIWKGASTADAVGILGTRLSTRPVAVARKEQQGLCYTVCGDSRETPPGSGAQECRCKALEIMLI